jgi:hemerythrin-like domain-containing protein
MTTNLIEDLKIEHAKIAKALNEVISIGLSNEEGRKKLMDAKEMLMQHLEKEDKYLYPVLEEAAKEDRQIKHTLDSFLKDMEAITKLALDFFEKYEKGGGGLEFANDFGHLYTSLSMRIRREENYLYKIFSTLKNE